MAAPCLLVTCMGSNGPFPTLVRIIIAEDTGVDGRALCATFGELRSPALLLGAHGDGANALLNESSASNNKR